MNGEMLDRCFEHARIAARRGALKGLDPEVLGHALMFEGLRATFQIDQLTALQLSKHATAYAREMLLRSDVENAADQEGARELKQKLDAQREPWEIVLDAAVSAVSEKLGKLNFRGSAAAAPRR